MPCTEFCKKLESDNFRPMGVKLSPGRASYQFCFSSPEVRGQSDKAQQSCTYVKYFRRGRKLIRKTCYRNCPLAPDRSRFLQHFLCCSQKGRRDASYSKPEANQCLFTKLPLQDGILKVHNSGTAKRRLGCKSGPKRCISSNSGVPTSQKISKVLYKRDSLSVQSNAIRNCYCPPGIHKDYGSSRRVFEKPSNSHLHVPRRLVSEKSVKRSVTATPTPNSSASSGSGFNNKFEKVPFTSFSKDFLSRGNVRSSEGDSVPHRGTFQSSSGSNFINNGKPVCNSKSSITPTWSHGFLYRYSPICTLAYAPFTVVPSLFLATPQRQPFSVNPSEGILSTSSSLVEREKEYFQGCTFTGLSTFSNTVDRRLNMGLGSSFRVDTPFGTMASSVSDESHKLAGVESNLECSHQITTLDSGSECFSQMRQFNCSGLCKQTGRDEITQPVYSTLGHVSVVPQKGHSSVCCPHPREAELSGGQLVQGSQSCENYGMESTSLISSGHFQDNGDPKHRFICHKKQSQTSGVLQSSSRPSGICMRCSSNQLEGNVCLCFSSPNFDSQSSVESEERVVCSSASSSLCSSSVMVPTITGVVNRYTNKITNKTRHAISKQRSKHPSKSSKFKSGSLEDSKRSSSSGRFSKEASKLISKACRQSTRKLYEARLRIFRSWCSERNISATTASVEDIADFFIFLYKVKNCKATTIMGYRSAISSVHKGWSSTCSSVSSDLNLSKLIKGIFNESPNIKPLLPNWDLPSVLWKLCDPPFEPLTTCDLKFLTWKTVFLVALASASRVSEIHALSIKKGNLRFERHGIRLLPDLFFLSKTQRLNKPWTPMFIPDFNTYATDDRDLLLCPCRALKIYLERLASHRSNSESVFMTYQKGLCKPASKNTISRWIVSLIRYAYNLMDNSIQTVRAHDTRRLSTSWALYNGASVSEIMKAAHWASENTFTSFYMKDVPTDDARFAKKAILDTARCSKK